MAWEDALSAYDKFTFEAGPWARPVYRRGQGPAVIVIHEIPGLHPLVIRFADRVAEAVMTVFLPSLIGDPGRPVSGGYALKSMATAFCVRREFNVWRTGRTSPIADWLRALARKAHAECGGSGVGAVGMCFSGGFALAMMTDPSVVAPVLSQPSLPLPFGSRARAADIDVSPEDLRCVKDRLEAEDLTVMGLRFRSDKFVPDARFETLKRVLGDRFEPVELEDEDAAPADMPPHSVLTLHLREDGPTKAAEQKVITFFRQRTGA
ncbi:MAG: dienelactone hydrolase family protein [Phenylobacterium sp.]|uniref:dienelactone hydrolase family protein n=1 Tax=Brevundimonas sp. TaxID=1871086 RepID=UPI00391BA1AD|nr:dienelactone hydrolase family protein [Phenylobacterium sp.]